MDFHQLSNMPEIVAECVRLHRLNRAQAFRRDDAIQLDRLKSAMPMVFELMSTAICQAVAEQRIVTIEDDVQPGYVVVRVGDVRAFVPFFSASIFPHGQLLKELCELGDRLQVGSDSVICISGSMSQLGLGLPIGDCDFCEYLPNGDRAIAERLTSKLVNLSPHLVCTRVVLGHDATWRPPWNGEGEDLTQQLRLEIEGAEFRQCTFLASVPSLGVMEATNLLLLLDFADRESAEAHRSFAYQEMPLARDGWVPRQLASPLVLGEYVDWLVNTASELCGKARKEPRACVKAARRALSASRLLFLHRHSDALVRLLSDDAARLAALFDRCHLYAEISSIADEAVKSLADDLAISISQLRESDLVTDCSKLSELESAAFVAVRDRVVPRVEDALYAIRRSIRLDSTA
ncbi:hypothetical protein QTI66_00390 [Variovorax sp. J22R133]|uniref:hypothetical protein n=1 Tax=Variovorax brevis TaxID=3053503 RepID=UPI002574DCEB|nr:hypothetical protein [Variovorax sp. J22R133]MDM0110582.1 hypothetical protein [Variovorax sp. J22R133]